ncbi:DUF998 domain-containing protein [Nonomuraea sp. NPDC050310]|uniref:DUF998 domain-containing protein n=1 Tax=unclassified Nonomuraea TaxID=2593643 RepID=UPI0033C427E1
MTKGVVAGCGAALAGMIYVHVALPMQPLLSDYALLPGGMLPVMLGMLALAGGCLSLAYGLTLREPNRSAAARVLLMAAGGGLMLSAIFPTDPHSGADTLGGEIHRWAAAVFFTALPVAGWVLARGREAGARWGSVRVLSGGAGLVLAAYLLAHPASFISGWIDGAAYYGLLERALVGVDLVLLVGMAIATGATATARTAAPEPAEPDADEPSPLRLVA